MVLVQNYLDLIKENKSLVSLTLPNVKECFLQITYGKSKCCNAEYIVSKPVLPFARSDQFLSCIKSWRRLSAVNDECKDIYEIDFDISGSNFVFSPGDTIGVIPRNNALEVSTVISHLDLDDVKDLQYNLSIEPDKKGKIPLHIPVKSSIEYVLTYCVDLRGVVKKLFLLALSRHTKDEKERKVLEYLCSKEGSTKYTSDILNKNICFLDLLHMFKSCKPPVQVIFEHLPRLLPRPYSIVNSSNSHSNLIKICFSVMDIGNKRRGLTSGWMEQLILNNSLEVRMGNLNINSESNNKIPIYLRRNLNGFTLPIDTGTPIILIGPGTGVAPFIGFLEEREYIRNNNSNKDLGPAWLFFGCRSPHLDHLYEKELNTFLNKNILSNLSTAFSRVDNCKNKYVQDALIENAAELIKLIKSGAYVYICGDVKVIASQVKEVLIDSLIKYDNITTQEAEKYVNDMQKERRYITDIWN
ncbi:methionine synthase reductase [Zerene cesonia]|uniref:methionine synthase reductase n=1 Tax=Zerene cesonia TaxID=33412 RepID=UPI0018E57B3C|nr:methionine synthase reductase [Zerene cesonia]